MTGTRAEPWNLATYRRNYDRLLELAQDTRTATNVGRKVLSAFGAMTPGERYTFEMTVDEVPVSVTLDSRRPEDG